MPSIFTWKCSYYKNSTRKWINGSLRLRLTDILFIKDDKKSEDKLKVIIDFHDICEIKKATSTLIYSSIVFKINCEFLWFSSFSNRDNVFNTIEHFWKQQLLGAPTPGASDNNELLRIAHGTQTSLMEAANTLHAQGKQINNAGLTMNMVHNDLTVAERVANDLDSYFSSWHVKGPPSKVPNLVLEREDLSVNPDRIEYSILFANIPQESHKTGFIVLNNDSIDIMNDKSVSIYSSPIKQLSKIDVNSPWDITITKRAFGKADISLHLISTKMPSLIETLQRVYDVVLNYGEVPECSDSDDDDDDVEDDGFRKEILLSSVIAGRTNSVEGVQTQLTSEDNKELSKVLNNIKSMALNISAEQDAQIKQIDLLNHSVNKAQTRIHSTDRKVKKMT